MYQPKEPEGIANAKMKEADTSFALVGLNKFGRLDPAYAAHLWVLFRAD